MEIRPWDRLQQILPPLSEYEQRALAESIKKDGVKYPVLVLPDGRIVDRYHRWKLSDGKAPVEVLSVGENEAFVLGLALNIARRQLSPEQIREIQRSIARDKELRRKLALELRKQKKTQAEVAAIVGVSRETIDKWEKGSNGNFTNTSPPDLRYTVSKQDYEKIYELYKDGKSQAEIAANFKISRRRVGQIIDRMRTLEEQQKTAGSELKVNKSFLSQAGDIIFDGFELRFTDCITAMKEMKEESIDCIITDPPYGISFSSPRYRNSRFSVMQNDQGVEAALAAIREFPRILAKDAHAYVFTRWDVYPWIAVSIPEGIRLTNLLVWDKGEGGHGMGDLDTYAPNYELIMLLEKGDRKLGGQRSSNVLRFRDIRFTDEPKYHPTQKPVDLIKFLIAKSTDPGETVLDPFAGSATTGIACLMTGRKFVGFEIDRTFEAAVRKRLAEVVNNG